MLHHSSFVSSAMILFSKGNHQKPLQKYSLLNPPHWGKKWKQSREWFKIPPPLVFGGVSPAMALLSSSKDEPRSLSAVCFGGDDIELREATPPARTLNSITIIEVPPDIS